MVGKSSTGAFSTGGFSDIEWGNGYTEGNAWHHSFPPYALSTMIGLYGSKEKYLSKLKKILTLPGDFKFGSYREVGHNFDPCVAWIVLFHSIYTRVSSIYVVYGINNIILCHNTMLHVL